MEAEVVDIPVTTTADQMEVAVHQVLPISQTIPDTQIPHSLPKWLCRRSRPNIYYTIISTSRYRYSRRRSRNYEFNFRIRHLLLAGPLRHSFDNHTYNFLSHSKIVRHPMKILDRYVISTFLKNYLIAFFVLIGMYVTLDMVFNFDELVQVQERANVTSGVDSAIIVIKAAADYYFYQLFSIFVQLSGMIPVAAAAFTLIRFSRFNELSAMLSSGVPLLRVASPIIIVALVLNGLLLLDQELLIPSIIPKLVRSRQEAGQETTTKDYQIPAMQDERNAVLNVARYRPGPGNPVMFEFTLVERDKDLQPTSMITAKRAQWEPGGKSWVFAEGAQITKDNVKEVFPNFPTSIQLPARATGK